MKKKPNLKDLELKEWFMTNEVAVAAKGTMKDYQKACAKRELLRGQINKLKGLQNDSK